MPIKITKLTSEQIAHFGEWVDKWVKIGLSTEPADFERAEVAALQAYELCNLARPKVILRVGSPYGAITGGELARIFFKQNESQVESKVRSKVWSQIRSQVGSQVESKVGSQVESKVQSKVWSQIRSRVESRAGSQIRSQVESQVWSQVESKVYNNSGVNNLWASWGAYISFFRDIAGWRDPVLSERFAIAEALIESCGWTWWHDDVLAISDRPLFIRRDDQGRLHSEIGPSMSYRDGWALWNWHGVSVPQSWIEDKTLLNAQTALRWENIEQRRAACEIVGWVNILRDLDGVTLDHDADPTIGDLIEVSLPDAGKEKFLRVLCGTGREFAIPVPSTMRTALEANAWTYDIPTDLLKQKGART